MCEETCSRKTLKACDGGVRNSYLNYGGFGCFAHGLIEVPGCFSDREEEKKITFKNYVLKEYFKQKQVGK